MTNVQRVSKALLLMLAGFGTYAGLTLSLKHMKVGEVCPTLGPVAACIIVFLGYLSVLFAGLLNRKSWAGKLFYLGWLPVFLLALSGVILELTKGQTCPAGAGGIPQCFYSLAMASTAWVLFRVIRKRKYAI